MYITVHTRKDVARDLTEARPRRPDTKHLLAVLADLGLHLRPLHSGVEDEELATHYFITVDDEQQAAKALQRLKQCPAVKAAYVKPAEGPPS